MYIRLSIHASDQIVSRGVTTAAEVLAAVSARQGVIARQPVDEVKVIVKTFSAKVTCADGSNGECVVACVDARSGVIKTVMLKRRSQVQRQIAAGAVYAK